MSEEVSLASLDEQREKLNAQHGDDWDGVVIWGKVLLAVRSPELPAFEAYFAVANKPAAGRTNTDLLKVVKMCLVSHTIEEFARLVLVKPAVTMQLFAKIGELMNRGIEDAKK